MLNAQAQLALLVWTRGCALESSILVSPEARRSWQAQARISPDALHFGNEANRQLEAARYQLSFTRTLLV